MKLYHVGRSLFGFSLVALLGAHVIAAAAVHLRASSDLAVRLSDAPVDAIGETCEFVAHRPNNSEAVLAMSGQRVIFRRGSTAVVDVAPMRYLVSVAQDGRCYEQAERTCHPSPADTAPSSCGAVPCAPDDSGVTLLSYLQSMAGGALAGKPPPERVLVIGLGSGALAAWLERAFPEAAVDAVDVSADVAAAISCFGDDRSQRLRITVDDGRHFLAAGDAKSTYDAIFVDAFDNEGSLPPCLATAEFFALTNTKLSPERGVLAMNLGARDDPGPVLAAMHKTFLNIATGRAPHLTNHMAIASQTQLGHAGGDPVAEGSASQLAMRWARDARFVASSATDLEANEPRTDSGGQCSSS